MKNIGIDDRPKGHTLEWNVPQISWGIFAVISFMTTALGMSETFFDEDWLGGVAISVGIQLLLIWMNRKIAKIFVQVRQKKILKWLIILVYAVTVLWSAGFSYVYISNHVYNSVFMRDDQDRLVGSYQRNMVVLKDLAESDFYDMLEMATEDVADLQADMTNTVTIQMENVHEDIEALRKAFVQNAEMLQIIDEAKKAMEGESYIITDDMMEILEAKIVEKNLEMKNKNDGIRVKENEYNKWNEEAGKAAAERYKYKEGTSIDQFLEKKEANATAKADKCETDIEKLQEEMKKIEETLAELEALKSYLSLLEKSVDAVMASSFTEILSLLAQDDLDAEKMSEVEELADQAFVALSEQLGKGRDNAVYAEKMKDFIKLKEHLVKLRDIRLVQDYCKDAQQETVLANTEKMVVSHPSKDVVQEWRDQWNDTYGNMKSNFYRLPSASKQEVIETCDQIAGLQRSLLTELNGVERGIYYLTCPHPLLAWLAFLLALFLDSSSIVFMLVKAGLEKVPSPGMVSGDLVTE